MSLRLELDKELERKFRELAMRRYGFAKGSIKKAAETAIKRWTETAEVGLKKEKTDVNARALEMLRKGFKMGKITWKSRDELHER